MEKEQILRANRAITLVTLIITIIIMLILLGVTVQVVINSNLLGVAQEAGNRTETAYENESKMDEITVEDEVYNSVDEYITQIKCSHEWGNWEIDKEKGIQTRICSKCNKTENTLILGSYVEGYNPSIAEDGSKISTVYESEADVNGYKLQKFIVESITDWQIVGQEKNQIIITTATPVVPSEGAYSGFYRLEGQSGYGNMIEELNKISSIYGQGKYADTTKYSVTLGNQTIASGGRSIKYEDIGYKKNTIPERMTYTKNEQTGYIDTNGISGDSNEVFKYWGENAEPCISGGWKELKKGESVTIVNYNYIKGNCTDKQQKMISGDGTSIKYWLANQKCSLSTGYVDFYAWYVWGDSVLQTYLCDSMEDTGMSYRGVRPVVYLKSDIQLSYDSETGRYTIMDTQI